MKDIAKYTSIDELVHAEFGESVRIIDNSFFTSSDFGTMYKIYLSDGTKLILKKGKRADSQKMNQAESFGLFMLEQTKSIAVPHVYGLVEEEEYGSVLSFVETSHKSSKDFWIAFAQNLAQLHKSPQLQREGEKNTYFGLKRNGEASHNFIGATPQQNCITHSWIEFFSTHRIWFQCKLAEKNGYFNTSLMSQAERFCSRLDTLIDEPPHPSLLHGDLWSGNFLCNIQGEPVLIDPAVYYGHYEAELAFTEMFGGFTADFYRVYHECLPLDKEYHHTRKSIYNLYHLLNHMNLFGRSYYHSAVDIISRFI